MVEDHEQMKTPWPSTACALLGIPPPFETLFFKKRERHGIQLRFISLASPLDPTSVLKSLIHVRLGFTTLNCPLAIRFDVFYMVDEIMNNLVRGKKKANAVEAGTEDKKDTKGNGVSKEKSPQIPKSLMTYSIQIDSGKIQLPPFIDVKLPLTRFSGERSSESGIFFETVLEKFEVAYGLRSPKRRGECLSLPQLAALPEMARMHILLCLKDLAPLEKAFSIKKEKNSFRRIKAVDKGILRMAKKVAKRNSKEDKKRSTSTSSSHGGQRASNFESRRQKILSEIMKLDDGELSELWSVHQRYQKKLAKKRNEEP
jgi:hypothetical protein